jgi:hypothetical protein
MLREKSAMEMFTGGFAGDWRGLEVEDEVGLFLRSVLVCLCLGE